MGFRPVQFYFLGSSGFCGAGCRGFQSAASCAARSAILALNAASAVASLVSGFTYPLPVLRTRTDGQLGILFLGWGLKITPLPFK